MLSLENISANIAGISVLRSITVQISRGSIVAVVGRNGAGKTTLLRLIMGFLPGHGGRVLLDGADMAQAPARNRARLGIGYAPEDRALFPTFSVEENLRFPCEVIGMPRRAVDERLDETLTIVPELALMLARSGATLSGGQGKMVALGRAVMAGERLVLLDEPFQGLAPKLGLIYTDALSRLKAMQPDICVVITESNVKLLGHIPDRIWTIERGSIELQQTL